MPLPPPAPSLPTTPQPHWVELFWWQSCTLLWLCGLAAWRWPWPAVLCAVIVFWADKRFWHPARAALGVLIMGAGLCLMGTALPQPPPTPAWLRTAPDTAAPPLPHSSDTARFPGQESVHSLPSPRAQEQSPLPLRGEVYSVQGLPDGRLRILLRALQPDTAPSANPRPAPLPALTVWTWEQPTFLPLPGQWVSLTRPLRPVQGLSNMGLSDSTPWWHSKNVFWRLWSRGNAGQPRIMADTPDIGARARAHIRSRMLAALHRQDENAPHNRTDNGTQKYAASPPLTQGQAFLPALLFGDRTFLASRTVELMGAASLVHSLALSGQHLALAGLAGLGLAWVLGFAAPKLLLRMPRLKWALCCSLPLALLYVWLGGAPASLWRACTMLLVLGLCLYRNNAWTTLDMLFAAVLVITLVWPLGIYDTGLQFSALCVAILALSVPLMRRIPRPALSAPHRRWKLFARGLAQICLVSFCIQLGLLPVSLLLFNSITPWFICNVLWLPLLSFWVMPLAAVGTLFACCNALSLAHGILWLATLPCDLLLRLLTAMSEAGLFTLPVLLRPHWTTVPAWGALLAAVFACLGHKRMPAAVPPLLGAACLLFLVGPLLRGVEMSSQDIQLRVLDVGQGQAIHLRLPGGAGILIDGGGSMSPRFDTGRDILSPSLSYNAPPQLWGIVCSHPDMDHLRGLDFMVRHWRVENIFYNNGKIAQDTAPDLQQLWQTITTRGRALHTGMRLPLPGAEDAWLEVLHPPRDSVVQGNNRSLILRIAQAGHGLVLLTGDAEKSALQTVLKSGLPLQADVLIMPHHGSRHSLVPAWYDAVRPQLAIVSCGAHNRYNYPSATVQKALQQRGIPLLTTARHGAMDIRLSPGAEPHVTPARH